MEIPSKPTSTPTLPAGVWRRTADPNRPKRGDLVPVLYYPTTRTKKGLLYLASWDHEEALVGGILGPCWECEAEGMLLASAKVLFWLDISIPERPTS